MSFENLTNDNILIYAIKSYDKPVYVKSELHDDMKHFSYVRRLLRRYRQCGELRERLILNHLIMVSNMFGVPASVRLLYFHVRPEDYGILKTFLLFLNFMPDLVTGIRGRNIRSSDLILDPIIVHALRKIKPI